ncbi:MAG: hypothetical protein H0T42_20580 [Deltaproteobacteria bacterium]|nr:hypothetical protein [Deltaproteobacteria bacterium]
MTSLPCIGEPISWLRLELFAAGRATDPATGAHLAGCSACQGALEEIRRDVVALPVLAMPDVAPRRASWWTWFVPALGLAAAAAIALLILAPWRDTTARREDVVAVKGVGEVIIDVVRERAGVIRDDVRTYAAGDRWKVVVTCPPAGSATFAVGVTESGRPEIDRPLEPATLACGNRVVLPGAFTLNGDQPNRVCVTITSGEDSGRACVTIRPE